MLAGQGGACVCGRDDKLWIDHDHSCCNGDHTCGKCFRGLLCPQCNSAIGLCGDDPERLRLLADYLDKWRAKG